MVFNFRTTGPFVGLTAARATQMVAHLPLTIDDLIIWGAEYSSEFWDALIEQVKHFHNLNRLVLCNTSVGGEAEGQEVGARLAKVISTNTTIKTLGLEKTDLIGADNTEEWGDALMMNNALTELSLIGVGNEIVDKLKAKTKNRALELKFS